MKTILASIGMLTATLAFAAPAAAECANIEETGTFVCAFADAPRGADVMAYQPGVGGGVVSRGEYSFFGMTFRNSYVGVSTDGGSPAGYNSVAVSEFCMADESGSCFFQEDAVVVWTEATGFVMVQLLQTPEGRTLCVMQGVETTCQAL